MLRGGARRARLRSALLLFLIAIAYAVHAAWVWHYTPDDAAITYAYALHVAQGQGFRAVLGGPTVEGYSNFLWLLLLVAAHKVGVAIPLAGKVLGAVLGGLGILLSIALLRRYESRDGELTYSDLALGLLLGFCSEYVIWSISGLENALFACLLLALIVRVLDEAQVDARTPFSSLLALCLSLTRPEGALYAVAIYGVFFLSSKDSRSARGAFYKSVALFVSLFIAYQVLHYAVFHDLRPNTYYAKRPRLDWQHLSVGWIYFVEHCQATVLGFGAPLALISIIAVRQEISRKLYALLAILAGVFFMLYAGGDWMGHFRLGAHLLPLYFVLIASGATRITQLSFFRREFAKSAISMRSRQAIFYGLCAIACAIWLQKNQHNFSVRSQFDRSQASHVDRVNRGVKATNRLAIDLDILPVTVAVPDFGAFAYASRRDFLPIDFLGLCDANIADIDDELPRESTQAQQFLTRSLFRERGEYPSLIYMFPGSFFAAIENSPERRQAYFQKTLPWSYVLFIHRGTLIHYYPPLDKFVFRELVDDTISRLQLLGFTPVGVAAAGQSLTLRLGLLRTTKLAQIGKVTLKLAASSGQNRVETVEKTLFHGDAVLLRQWQIGEPLYFELPINLPSSTESSIRFELGIQYDAKPWHWYPLSTVDAGTNLTVADEPLPRFPNGLLGPASPELFALESQLLALRQRRRAQHDLSIVDKSLAESLSRACRAHEAKGEVEDAYLACQWAMQADPDLTRLLHRRLHALRAKTTDGAAELLRELDLLRAYYANGSDEDAHTLLRFLKQRRHPREAAFIQTKLRNDTPAQH